MNSKAAVKYRFYDYWKALLIFYIVIAASLVFMFVFSALTRDNPEFRGSVQGLEIASVIFLFVLGLNSFKDVFMMFMQNGISSLRHYGGNRQYCCFVKQKYFLYKQRYLFKRDT